MKVISLINMKGGVGKTTLATNICHCLSSRMGKKVLLIDIDPQFNASQCVFSDEEYVEYLKGGKDTICSVFDKGKLVVSSVEGHNPSVVKELKDISPYKFQDNWYLLPGNLQLYKIAFNAGEGGENKLNRYIKAIQPEYNFDFVIIDTPPTPSVWMWSALIASDYYLIPVKPDPLSYIGIELLSSIIKEKENDLDLKIKCIGLVLTMVEERTVVYQGAVKYINNNPTWKNLKYRKALPKRTNIPKQQLNHQFILDINDAELSMALVNIVDEMIQRIEENEKKK